MSNSIELIAVGVRALCDFAARQGDLDHRFTPSPTALDGIAGHGAVTASRGEHYQTELTLSGSCNGLLIKGRADGYDSAAQCLEEIKTHRGAVQRVSPAQQALHLAQLKVYGALACQQLALDTITLALIYYDIDHKRQTRNSNLYTAVELRHFLSGLCSLYYSWAKQEQAHRNARDAALLHLTFPFTDFRHGQRALAETVYKGVLSQRIGLIQAPAGLGKTLGTLYPALLSLPRQQTDRLFMLSARNTGRQVSLQGVKTLLNAQHANAVKAETQPLQQEKQPGSIPLRVLELTAKHQACVHPDSACHGDACLLANGFYDKLAGARQDCVNSSVVLDQATIAGIASKHQLCPYYLAQEMARWSDVILADVNHYFDQHALLYALTVNLDWQVTLLLDEAHNLIDRSRDMYSISLSRHMLKQAVQHAPAELKAPLNKANRSWAALVALYKNTNTQTQDGEILTALPKSFIGALQQLSSQISDYLAGAAPSGLLQQLMFEISAFLRLLEQLDTHSVLRLQGTEYKRQLQVKLSIENLIPAPFLQPRFNRCQAAVLFSATLSPGHYYQDLLGLPDNCYWQDTPSPFNAQQLNIHISKHISTRYQHRAQSLLPICQLIIAQYQQQRGNYLVFVSSFSYLQQIAQQLAIMAPDLTLWQQSADMDQQQRTAFLHRFTETGCGIGFAVLGCVFAEGIDLPGKRLIGAFIATMGLPPVSASQTLLQQRLQQQFGKGYEYGCLYPGLQKVIQAAGRVIRTPEDTGWLYLLDQRFLSPQVQQLMPAWWQLASMPES